MTGGEDRTALVEVTPEGNLILSRDIGGEENPGIYLMNRGGGELQEIFKKKNIINLNEITKRKTSHETNESERTDVHCSDVQP